MGIRAPRGTASSGLCAWSAAPHGFQGVSVELRGSANPIAVRGDIAQTVRHDPRDLVNWRPRVLIERCLERVAEALDDPCVRRRWLTVLHTRAAVRRVQHDDALGVVENGNAELGDAVALLTALAHRLGRAVVRVDRVLVRAFARSEPLIMGEVGMSNCQMLWWMTWREDTQAATFSSVISSSLMSSVMRIPSL